MIDPFLESSALLRERGQTAVFQRTSTAPAVAALVSTLEPAPDVTTFRRDQLHSILDQRERPSCVLAVVASPHYGLHLIRTIEERDSTASLVLLSTGDVAPTDVAGFLEHHVVHIVEWPTATANLVTTIDAALARSHAILGLRKQRDDLRTRFECVTKREVEVLRLLGTEATSDAIASQLEISKRTVDDHRSALLRKTGYASTAAVVHAYDQYHLVESRERSLSRGLWRPRESAGTRAVPKRRRDVVATQTFASSTSTPCQPHCPPDLERLGVLLREHERADDPVCLLDARLRIVWWNAAWSKAVPSHGRRFGRRYVDHVAHPLRPSYTAGLRAAMSSGRAWEQHRSQPTEEEAQTWRISAELVESYLLVRHSLVSRTAHPPGDTFRLESPTGEEFRQHVLRQCAACRRVSWPQTDRMVLVLDWLENDPPAADSFLCPDCATSHGHLPAGKF